MAVTMKLSVYWDVTPLNLVPHHIHEAIKLSHNLNTHTTFEILNLTNSVSQRLQFETQQCYVRLYNVRHLVMCYTRVGNFDTAVQNSKQRWDKPSTSPRNHQTNSDI